MPKKGKDMKNILISGYYGFGNSGDDALLFAIINDIKLKISDADITVLSANPSETEAVYNVKSVDRWKFGSVMRAVKSSDLLISGGGTLIQDDTSTKSLLYYLGIIILACFFKTKIMLYSNGIGPLNKRNNRIFTRKVLNKADVITLRDEASRLELNAVGVTKPKIELTADPAFLLRRSGNRTALSEYKLSDNGYFIVSVRNWKNLSADFTGVIAGICDYIADNYNITPVFLPMQRSADSGISREAASKMKNKSVIIERYMSIDETLELVYSAKLCLGMRLHTLIYAASQGVPIIGLVYDPKINGFMDYIGQKMYTDASGVKFEDLKNMTDKCMRNYDGIKADIDKKVDTLRALAEKNTVYIQDILNRGGKTNG